MMPEIEMPTKKILNLLFVDVGFKDMTFIFKTSNIK